MAPALLERSSWHHPYTTRLPTEKPDEPEMILLDHAGAVVEGISFPVRWPWPCLAARDDERARRSPRSETVVPTAAVILFLRPRGSVAGSLPDPQSPWALTAGPEIHTEHRRGARQVPMTFLTSGWAGCCGTTTAQPEPGM